jgi:hypothetical protein
MTSTLDSLLHALALNESSGATDFLSQVSGLLLVTCVAGAAWVALMALVWYRASERRRRAAQGLAPLPSLPATLYRRLTGAAPDRPTPARAPSRPPRPAAPAMPLPDLAMLTGSPASAVAGPAPAAEAALPAQRRAPAPPPDESAGEADARPVPAEDDAPGPATPASLPGDVVELLRVYRDLDDGGLIVAMGDQQIRSPDDLHSAGLARRFENVLREMEAFARPGRAATARAGQDREAPVDEIASLAPRSMLRQVTRVAMGQPVEGAPEQPERSIADQVEELLQDHLRQMPQFAGRSIHIRPALSGGVQIEVDGVFYEGVGDVDDEEIRALLVTVVRAWEESN